MKKEVKAMTSLALALTLTLTLDSVNASDKM